MYVHRWTGRMNEWSSAWNPGISKTFTVFYILQRVLKLDPYKLQSVSAPALIKCETQAIWICKSGFVENWGWSQWFLNILWTHFSLHGTVDTQNCRIWEKENPHAYTAFIICYCFTMSFWKSIVQKLTERPAQLLESDTALTGT